MIDDSIRVAVGGTAGIAVGSTLLIAALMWLHDLWREPLFRWALAICFAIALLLGWATVASARDISVGDSIAKGTGEALGAETHAVVGAGSCTIVGFFPPGHFDHAVVSAGINDGGKCVAQVRAKVDADVVVWILPANINKGYAAVRAVARAFGDRTVRYTCRGGCTKTNFHPDSYAKVARWVRVKWNDGRLPPATFATAPVRTGR